jgi:hypothetical protein
MGHVWQLRRRGELGGRTLGRVSRWTSASMERQLRHGGVDGVGRTVAMAMTMTVTVTVTVARSVCLPGSWCVIHGR